MRNHITLVLLSSLILSACGSQGTQTQEGASSGNVSGSSNPIHPGGPNPNPSSNPDLSGFGMTGLVNTYGNLNLAGYASSASAAAPEQIYTTPAINTDNLFLVKVRSEGSGQLTKVPNYSNFNAIFNCAKYVVTLEERVGNTWVLRTSEVTQPLQVSGRTCEGGVNEQVLNWSGHMYPGHGQMRVRIQNDSYDFYCNLYQGCIRQAQMTGWWPFECQWMLTNNFGFWQPNPNVQASVCPMKTVYQTHILRAQLQINYTQP
jgi:hypothetical protein